MTKECTLVASTVNFIRLLCEGGRQPLRTQSYSNTQTNNTMCELPGNASTAEWASWGKQEHHCSSRIGSQSLLNEWNPNATQHCLYEHSAVIEHAYIEIESYVRSSRMRFRTHQSGVLIHSAQLSATRVAIWLGVSPAGEDEPLRGNHDGLESRLAEPSGPQQLPDSRGTLKSTEQKIRKAHPTAAEITRDRTL